MKNFIDTLIITSMVVCFSAHTLANGVNVKNLAYTESNGLLTFDVNWQNGFRIEDLAEDGILIFGKYKNSNSSQWKPLNFTSVSASVNDSEFELEFTNNVGGAFANFLVKHSSSLTGSFPFSSVGVTVRISSSVTLVDPSFKIFGTEMVINTIPEGYQYQLGDGISDSRFHKGNNSSLPFSYFFDGNSSENVIIGGGSSQLNSTGNINNAGTSVPRWYFDPGKAIMRYEISQQQYIDYLNCLSRPAQNEHTQTDISGTSVTAVFVMPGSNTPNDRNGIRCDATLPVSGPITFYSDLDNDDIPNEFNDGQTVSANYLLPKDLLGYLDWATLKPMNEAQYEFYCRGTDTPLPGEFAWGSTGMTAASYNIGASGGANEVPTNIGSQGLFRRSTSAVRSGANANSTTTRIQAGATFFGVMDMTGNVAEMVIGLLGTPDLALVNNGDGEVDLLGNTDEIPWPSNLVTRGLASGNTNVNPVSQRDGTYVPTLFRIRTLGGRGILQR